MSKKSAEKHDYDERISVAKAKKEREKQDKIWSGLGKSERDEVLSLYDKLCKKREKERNY